MALKNHHDLEQIYKDQDPGFFIKMASKQERPDGSLVILTVG